MSDQKSQNKLTRRDFIRLSALTGGAAMLGACATQATPQATSAPVATQTVTQAAAAGKKYEGVVLRGLGQGGVAYQEALKTFAKEFGDTTGAKIEFDDQPWENLMPKLQAELAASSPTYDFFYGDIEFQYSTYPSLVDFNPLIKKYNYNMEGFFDPVYKYGEGVAGGLAGKRFGLPIRIGACWVFYRTDLIKEFPTTWDAYYKLLAEQTGGGKYGVAFAGVAAQLVKLFLARYWSMGDPLMKPDWTPLINSEKGVKSVEMMLDALNYSNPGILGWDNPDASSAFLNGDAAVLEGWASFILPDLQNPEKSKVVDKWSVAQFPENGSGGNLTQHNLDIFASSKNIDAAFEYIAYVTGLENSKRVMLDFKEESPRQVTWSDPDVLKAEPFLPAVEKLYGISKPFTPGLAQWLELFVALAEGLSSAMSKQASPKDAMDTTAKKWTDAINQAKPSWEYKE